MVMLVGQNVKTRGEFVEQSDLSSKTKWPIHDCHHYGFGRT